MFQTKLTMGFVVPMNAQNEFKYETLISRLTICNKKNKTKTKPNKQQTKRKNKTYKHKQTGLTNPNHKVKKKQPENNPTTAPSPPPPPPTHTHPSPVREKKKKSTDYQTCFQVGNVSGPLDQSHLCIHFPVSAHCGIVELRKAHKRSAPSPSSVSTVALETIPMFVWLNTDRTRPRTVERRPLPFSTPPSFSRSMI